MRDTVYCCSRCGSFKVEHTAWVQYNSGKLVNYEAPTDREYCAKCDDETDVATIDRNKDGTWSAYPIHGPFPTLREAVRFVVKEYGY